MSELTSIDFVSFLSPPPEGQDPFSISVVEINFTWAENVQANTSLPSLFKNLLPPFRFNRQAFPVRPFNIREDDRLESCLREKHPFRTEIHISPSPSHLTYTNIFGSSYRPFTRPYG